MQSNPIFAVIGGSGLYDIQALQNTQEHLIDTPFGKPSAPIVVGTLTGTRVAFLARHGIGHHISPTEINYRANIYALKTLGVQRIISISACGSLREDYAPGDIVVPDQIYDATRDRKRSFFEDGLVAHISIAEPFCNNLSKQVAQAVQATGVRLHNGGTMITIEGPRFSTRAESNVYRAWGVSIIGMTTSPEAFLAREAEMCYSVMAHVTDYDVWHISEQPVSVEMVIRVLNQNTHAAQQAIVELAQNSAMDNDCTCHHALADALITRPDVVPAETRKRLSLLVDKYLLN
jgi:5'-methylthioadenosine phosphorylase